MIRITAALECDGCGVSYDEPVRVRKLARLERWIERIRMEATHPAARASERWADGLPALGLHGDYCPRCQMIAARQSLEASP